MIFHIVLLRLKPEIGAEETDAFVERAKRVLGPIPGVRNLRIGRGLDKKAERSHPLALLMEFEDDDALAAYQIHPEHQRFVHEIVGPIQEDKQVYDYRY